MTDVLDPRQRAVAERALDEESAARRHLVVALSGGHAYGFPSPDSDLDLKAIHIAPTERLLGLSPPPTNAPDRIEVIDGVEIDAALRELVARSLSRRLHRHYRGFATGQLREWEKDGFRSAKKLLYVLRTTLTGTHALLTGQIETDVTLLLDEHGFAAARALVEAKRRGERSELAPEVAERWRGEVGHAFDVLDAALSRSVLPEEPPNVDEIEAWLVELRRRGFNSLS